MQQERQSKGKLTMKMKRQRANGTEKEEERDRLSELPDYVLLHIMKFLITEHAVQTCVLSKRWKNLWKVLTTLTFSDINFRGSAHFNRFVWLVLAKRDKSVSVLDVNLHTHSIDASKLMNKVMEYAVLHNVQQLTIETILALRTFFSPLIFSCRTLTFLKIRKYSCLTPLELPKSLQLPSLKTLVLANVRFTASGNGSAEPFSTCSLLNTLVLEECYLSSDTKVFFISNSNLSSLKLDYAFRASTTNIEAIFQHKIVLSTPNLSSLTMLDDEFSCSYYQFSSTCNLSWLERGIIHMSPHYIYSSVIIGRLQVLTNVKSLTLNWGIFKIILRDLSHLASTRTQPPCFVRLESLKMKMNPDLKISDEEVNRVTEYLLQNSPLAKDAAVNC